MESKAKVAGHPLHTMLVVFPLGLLATSLIFDLIYRGTGRIGFATASYYMLPAGIIGGLLAAVPGLIDWLAIPANTRAKALGLWHAVGNVIVLICFGISWALRYNNTSDGTPTNAAIAMSVLGGLIAVLTGWLGGEMVNRLGIGVDPGAHVNAPNSLGKRPANETDMNYINAAENRAPATTSTTGLTPGRGAMGRATEPSERRSDVGAARPTTQDIDRGGPPV
jgi:uncharacterized membrane protein